MTAFLMPDVLRAHAVAALFWTNDRAPSLRRLTACWLLNPAGRLICQWKTDTADPSLR